MFFYSHEEGIWQKNLVKLGCTKSKREIHLKFFKQCHMGITNFSNDQNNRVNGKFGSREEAKSKKEYIRGIFG